MREDTIKGMSSSKSIHWCTPEVVLERVRKVNKIGLDPCSNQVSTVGACLELSINGEKVDWCEALEESGGLAYCNPPYGKSIKTWSHKCKMEAQRGAEIIALLPARTDTKWFQGDVFSSATALCFWRGRLTFIDGTGQISKPDAAFFPSVLAYWGNNGCCFYEAFHDVGSVVDNRIII